MRRIGVLVGVPVLILATARDTDNFAPAGRTVMPHRVYATTGTVRQHGTSAVLGGAGRHARSRLDHAGRRAARRIPLSHPVRRHHRLDRRRPGVARHLVRAVDGRPARLRQLLPLERPTAQPHLVRRGLHRADVGFASPVDGVPTDFSVQTWDGTGWATQAQVTGNSALYRWIPFPSTVSTAQVRVVVTASQTQNGNFTRIGELTP
jgi:hypothetical protein